MLKLSIYFSSILLLLLGIFYMFFYDINIPYDNKNVENKSININDFIVKSDLSLSSVANKVVSNCNGSKGCKNLEIYKYIRENYILDNKSKSYKDPVQTLRNREGSYLDLSLLYSSLLLNVGVSSFIKKEDDKYFVYACGISQNEMYNAIVEDLRDNPLIKKDIVLKKNQVWAYDFNRNSKNNLSADIDFYSQKPVNVVLFPNKTEMNAYLKGQYSRYDKECSKFNTTDIKLSCIVPVTSILIVQSLDEGNKFKGYIYEGGILPNDIQTEISMQGNECIKADINSRSSFIYPGIL